MKNVRVLLDNPEGAVNLGFIARAMANTGFLELYLTGRLNPDDKTARKYALAAGNILDSAVRCENFDSLISNADRLVGISMRTPQTETSDIHLSELPAYINDCAGKGLTVGLLFGNEKAGIPNAHLSFCSSFVSLDTTDIFPSMNLAQAVLTVLWQIKDVKPKQKADVVYADRSLHNALQDKLRQFLDTFGCLNPQNPDKIMDEIRQSVESKFLTAREAQLLLSVLGKAMAEHNNLIKKMTQKS